jgi:hypothetical protein
MPIIDKEFFLTHLDEIKNIFDLHGVKKAVIHFADIDTILFLDFKEKASHLFVKIKNDLINLGHKYNVAYTLKLSNFIIFDQEVPIPEGSINFEDLLEAAKNIQGSNNSLATEPEASPSYSWNSLKK